ncbi:MAG TPA: YaeQ family protein [Gammaproteobacteria bacterium]|nr:YaeQ family protein [Gammaproteobacteria bacterium]
MAIKSTIYKANLQMTDLDRGYYQGHNLTLALHPSETEQRMMLRLLAFALHADEALTFTKGISTEDEPDLWQKNLSNDIEYWIDLGQPDEKRIRRACGRARQVLIYSYNERSTEPWWSQNRAKLQRFDNLSVIQIKDASSQQLTELAERSMRLQCTIQDGQVWFANDAVNIEIEMEKLKEV